MAWAQALNGLGSVAIAITEIPKVELKKKIDLIILVRLGCVCKDSMWWEFLVGHLKVLMWVGKMTLNLKDSICCYGSQWAEKPC